MQATRAVLLTSCAIGILAVVAGMAGLTRVAAGGAVLLFVAFLVLPWMGRR